MIRSIDDQGIGLDVDARAPKPNCYKLKCYMEYGKGCNSLFVEQVTDCSSVEPIALSERRRQPSDSVCATEYRDNLKNWLNRVPLTWQRLMYQGTVQTHLYRWDLQRLR